MKEKHCHITEPSTMRTWNLNGPFAVRGKAISFAHHLLLEHSAYVIFSLPFEGQNIVGIRFQNNGLLCDLLDLHIDKWFDL